MVQLSHPYKTTEKTIALTIWTFVGKVMSLFCNMLSRFFITFLPRNKSLLISLLQSPLEVILEHKDHIRSVCLFTFAFQYRFYWKIHIWWWFLIGDYDRYLEKAMAPHSSTLAWKISWTEEPGRLQSMGSLRVGHNWATSLSLFTFMHWRRKWQATPVFLPGESQGWGSLVGCCLWGHTELDMTEAT